MRTLFDVEKCYSSIELFDHDIATCFKIAVFKKFFKDNLLDILGTITYVILLINRKTLFRHFGGNPWLHNASLP